MADESTDSANMSDDQILLGALLKGRDQAFSNSDIMDTQVDDSTVSVPASELISTYDPGFEQPLPVADEASQAKNWSDHRSDFYNDLINEGSSEKEALEKSRLLANGSMLLGQYGVYDRPDEEFPVQTGVIAAGARSLGSRRPVSVQRRPYDPKTGKTQTVTSGRFQDRREATERYQYILDKEGAFSTVKEVMKGPQMTVDEAKQIGFGVNRQTFFGRDKEDEDQRGLFIPYGLKNLDSLAERAAVKISIPNIFSNLFLEEEEREAYLKEYRNVVPTENFERLTEVVESSSEKGLTDEEIGKTLEPEIGSILLMQSYMDLPVSFRLQKPSVEKFKSFLKSDPDAFKAPRDPFLLKTIEAVDRGKSNKEIQSALNQVSFGSLPEEVWAGSTGSPKEAIREAIRSARKVIEAKGEAGKVSRSLEASLVGSLFEQEKIQDEIMVVESTIGKLFRGLGVFTEGAAEARLPFDIPITPASRDFYYSLGIRSQDSTWLARILANIETGNVGFTMHATDEARARNMKRGEGGFHAALFLGGALDFLVPWEKLHLNPASWVVKGTARGSSMVKKIGVKDFRRRAFLSGFSPKFYDMIYRVHERAMLSFDRLSKRLPENAKSSDVQVILDQDDAVRVAQSQGLPPIADDAGNEILPMSLQDRTFTEQLKVKMDEGASFIDATDDLRNTYQPNLFDTTADAGMAVVKHLIETDEAGTVFKKSAQDPNGVIPFEMDVQVQRTIAAAGFDPSEVINIVRKRTNQNREAYLNALRVVSETSDRDTVDLRATPEYVGFRKKLDDLVDNGDLLDEQKVILLNIMETRAYNAAGIDRIKTIPEPKDFFKQAKINKVSTKLTDGSLGPESIQVKVGKIFETDKSDVSEFIDFLSSDDMMSMTKLLDNDQSLLVTLMGKGWTNKFFESFDTEVNPNVSTKMPKNRLKESGKIQAERVLRTLFEAEGNLSSQTQKARQLFENITAVYARIDERLKNALIPLNKKAMLDTTFRPDRFFRNGLIERNMRQSYVPGQIVRVSPDDLTALIEERPLKAGRKRVFSNVDTQPEYVRQGLGMSNEMVEMDAVDLYTRSIGYVIAETMKMEEANAALRGMDIVNLTGASFARRDQVKPIRKRVNARMASVLGVSKHSKISKGEFLDAKQLRGMADAKNEILKLNDVQQASFKVFLQRLASEPFVASKIPDNLMGAGAKLDEITFSNYNRVVELLTDVEAGMHARRTVYTEVIPRSLAYSLLNTFRASGLQIGKTIKPLDDLIKGIEARFSLDDPLKNIRPELKELFRRHLSELSNIRQEVVELARKARKENPDATIELIFDKMRNQLEMDMRLDKEQVRMLVGITDIAEGQFERPGLLSILTDFTEAEKARISVSEAISTESDMPAVDAKSRRIATGRDFGEEAAVKTGLDFEGEYAMPGRVKDPDAPSFVPIGEGETRFQYLTKQSTREQLQHLCNQFGGMKGITEELDAAFTSLERFSSESGMSPLGIKNLSDEDRIVLGSAIYKIQSRLEDQQRYAVRRGEVILQGLGGVTAQLDKVSEIQKASAYIAFHEGGAGWVKLLKFAMRKGNELGFDQKKISRYSPAQAYLEMVVRLMAEDKLQNMFDDMIKAGMPGAAENYRIPKSVVSPTGAKYSIDTPNAFYDRVKGYMNLIFKESKDIRIRVKLEDNKVKKVEPDMPSGEGIKYHFASYEQPKGPSFANGKSFQDLEARIAAEETLVRFGMTTRGFGEDLAEIVFPDGSVVYGPSALKDELQDALNRTAAVGASYGTESALILDQSSVGIPYVNIDKSKTTKGYALAADGVTQLLRMFPVTAQNIKKGITTGLFIPNVAYYTANFMGGALQLMTATNPIHSTSIMLKNPRMTLAVMSRMFGKGNFRPDAGHLIVAKNGMLYNADQLGDMAMSYRLNSSFIQAETQRSMAEDIKQYVRKNQTFTSNKATDFSRAWNDKFTHAATAVDNFYRVSIFIDRLNDGVSPSQAASLAKKAAFDYGALTDFEKRVMRNTIMFYSYMRKNMDLFYDTLLTNPSRVTNQLRLTNGLHRANLNEDPQAVLPEYLQQRFAPLINKALFNKHAYDQRMYVVPPIPLMDSANMFLDTFDAISGDQEAQRMLLSRLTPWAQAPFVLGLNVDPFYGQELSKFNKVPQYFLEWDLAITGGTMKSWLNVNKYTPRNSRLRLVEGDEDRQMNLAENGELWWFLRNAVQLPGFGRSMTIFEQADRANLGVIETITETLRNIRIYLEEAGMVDVVSDQFLEGDTMSPRIGLTMKVSLLLESGRIILKTLNRYVESFSERTKEPLTKNILCLKTDTNSDEKEKSSINERND